MITIYLRFYEELNDFLPDNKQKITFTHQVPVRNSIKDVIEALGIPRTEVDLILVNGNSVNFSYQVQNNDAISVYPTFEGLNIQSVTHLREKPLRNIRFILDVHLGKLARLLRLFGFDCDYQRYRKDQDIISESITKKRVVLTRDIGLLKNKKITHGYWLRNTDPFKQLEEILLRFDLAKECKPFSRCLLCNGLLKPIEKAEVEEQLDPLTRQYYQLFWCCIGCEKLYWQGSHYQKLKELVEKIEKKL